MNQCPFCRNNVAMRTTPQGLLCPLCHNTGRVNRAAYAPPAPTPAPPASKPKKSGALAALTVVAVLILASVLFALISDIGADSEAERKAAAAGATIPSTPVTEAVAASTTAPTTTAAPITTAAACPGDKSDQITRLDDVGEFSSQEDADVRDEVKLTIKASGAEDFVHFKFCGTITVVIEQRHYNYPDDYYTKVGEFSFRVRPENFTGYAPAIEYVIDDDTFPEDGMYRATVTVVLDKDGRTLSTAGPIYYSNA